MLGISPMEMMILAVIGLLLFGKRLPDVARNLGKSMVEFKRGIRGIEDEVKATTNTFKSSYSDTSSRRRPEPVDDDQQEWTAPRFEPPTSEPVAASEKSEASATT